MTQEIGTGLPIGQIIAGEYRITRALRVGGMGAVYVAEQKSTGILRALKVMQRELVKDARLCERFEQEARIGARIESDHVVQVVGAGVDEPTGLPWMAMELLDGLPLDIYLAQRGPRPAGEVRYLFQQLCHALGMAHRQGIVHRDLKPANVFLSTPRTSLATGHAYVVKVLDFGIAKVLAEAKTGKTAAIGTPFYMAPEQYEAGKVTPATDVWALALIAFELLTGRSYWKSAADGSATPATIMYETCLADLVPPSSRDLPVPLPDGFDAWFSRCLKRQPDLRFLDADSAFESLAAVLGEARPPVESLPSQKRARIPEREPATLPMTRDGDAAPPNTQRTISMTESHASPAIPVGMPTPAQRAVAVDTAIIDRNRPTDARAASIEAPHSRKPLVLGGIVGALLLGIGAFVLSPPKATSSQTAGSASIVQHAKSATPVVVDPTQFTSGTTIGVEGRLLHKQIAAGAKTETYVMLELKGADVAPKLTMPVHMSLVIDHSGSMKGGRLQNAITAALGAIDRLRDGDKVSVVAFADSAETIVEPTVLDATSRPMVAALVKKLGLGGNTCMSCGLSTALGKVGTSPDHARRILLLSDGEANLGIKELPGFELLARDAQKSDVSITTIGVGLEYDPKPLVALSRESNGQHYYAPTEAALPPIFEAQASAMAAVIATTAEAVIRLAPGVELVSVLDRAHRVEGSPSEGVTVRVPLGQFTRNERKTVLVKVALKPNDDKAEVADVEVSYRDVGAPVASKSTGTLAVAVGMDGSEVDPVVEARVKRSETAAALIQANKLFEQGKAKEASQVLAAQDTKLAAQKTKWTVTKNPYTGGPAPAPTVMGGVVKDVDQQQTDVNAAKKKYDDVAKAPPPAAGAPMPKPAAPAKGAANKSIEDAYNYGY